MKSTLAILLLILAVSGCSLAGFEGDVTAEANPPILRLDNQTNRTIYYIAAAGDELSRMDLDLQDYASWPTIEAGKAEDIAYENLLFYDEGDTGGWVYWTTEDDNWDMIQVSLQ
jgi:hypothetical protein